MITGLSQYWGYALYNATLQTDGQLAEWSKALAWNASIGQPI